MSKENYFHKIKELPEIIKQFGGLVQKNMVKEPKLGQMDISIKVNLKIVFGVV